MNANLKLRGLRIGTKFSAKNKGNIFTPLKNKFPTKAGVLQILFNNHFFLHKEIINL
jgi:hypothetical protein